MKTQLTGAYQKIAAFVTKNKKTKLISGGIALIAILLISTLAALFTQDNTKQPLVVTTAPVIAQVEITKDGFMPATLSVKKGTKVIWVNNDETIHQIQANPHPTGESLPGLKSEILNKGQTYEYTADTVGVYGYHDHTNPTVNGALDVTE